MANENTNKQTLLSFYRLFYNEKRFDEGAALLVENFVNHHSGTQGQGRKGMVDDFGRAARVRFPAFHIDARRVIAEGDYVWTHSLVTGLPEAASAVTVDIWRFENGAIAEHWDVGQALKADQHPGDVI